MGVLDPLKRRSRQVRELADLKEQVQQHRWNEDLLVENLQRLELSIAGDEGWRRLAAQTDREFTRSGLKDLIDISRAMYLSNPLIQRAVNVTTYYTWGQGVSFDAVEDEVQELVVDPLIADESNQMDLYSHQSLLLTDVDQLVDGNVQAALFTTPDGDVAVRSFPTQELSDIICSSDDRYEIQYYRRSWTVVKMDGAYEVRDELYPDIRYRPTSQPDNIDGIPVHWDAPVIHQKTGGLKQMRFGVPNTYAALDWARAYKKFLEDWHTLVASLARFAWAASTKESKVKRTKDRLNTTRTREGDSEETNHPPAAGSVAVLPEGDSLTPIPKQSAHTSADDSRPSRLMVASAMDLPDTILANDPQQGALATARSLDRPTELYMSSRQKMWAAFHQRIFKYKFDRMVEASQIGADVDPTVNVNFPPVLEHDPKETVSAIVTAATLEGKVDAGTVPREKVSELLMRAIGVEDISEALEDLGSQEQAELGAAVEKLHESIKELNSI